MEKKDSNLGLLLLFVLIVVLIIGGIGLIFIMAQSNNVETNKNDNNMQVVNENKSDVVKEVKNTITENSVDNTIINNVSSDTEYKITVIDKTHAIIEAIKNENSIKKEIEATMENGPDGFNSYSTQMEIDNTAVSSITGYGKVALITEKAEDYIVIRVFGLVDDEIKEFGKIDTFSSLLVKEVDYKTKKTEEGFEIVATRKSDNLTRSYSAILSSEEKVLNIETVSWIDDVQFVLVTKELFGKKEVTVFGLTELEALDRTNIEKISTLEDIPIN